MDQQPQIALGPSCYGPAWPTPGEQFDSTAPSGGQAEDRAERGQPGLGDVRNLVGEPFQIAAWKY
jgi:hypothetical protein